MRLIWLDLVNRACKDYLTCEYASYVSYVTLEDEVTNYGKAKPTLAI
jgi:hypothetical protein